MQSQNQHIDYELLITKYLSGEITDSEKEQLIHWLNQNLENRDILHQYEKTWNHSNYTHLKSRINVEHEWKVFVQKRDEQETKLYRKRFMHNPLLRIAAVLIAGILIASTVLYFYNRPIQYAAANTIKTIELDDGSIVVLNKHSVLEVQPFKNKQSRNLTLQGEAYFEVQPDPHKPFTVKTQHLTVTVLGTSFNVKEYTQKKYSNVIVNTGQVAVSHKSHKLKLKAGDRATLNRNEGNLTKQVNTDANYLSWKTHIFEFNNDSLKNVVETLNRVYDQKIILKDDSLNNCKITARFEKQSLQSIVEVLSSLLNVEIKQKNKTFEISGEGC